MAKNLHLDWSNWLYGLFAGAIGGGSAAVSSGVSAVLTDPHLAGSFSLLKLMGTTFIVSFFLSAFFYLKQNPLPTKIVKTVETVEHKHFPEATVTTTVEKTSTIAEPKA